MDFFSVTAPARGLMPVFNNAKYSWFYFLVAGAISLAVFVWWGYKRYAIHSQSIRPDVDAGLNVEAVEAVEALMSAHSNSELMRRKQFASLKRDEHAAELEELNQTRPSGEDDDELRHVWDHKQRVAFTKLLLAQRAMETAEDVDDIFAKLRNNDLGDD
jgi:hypothetical protein